MAKFLLKYFAIGIALSLAGGLVGAALFDRGREGSLAGTIALVFIFTRALAERRKASGESPTDRGPSAS